VLGLVLAHQPDGALAQFQRVRLRRLLRFHEPHPSKSWGLRETRRGSNRGSCRTITCAGSLKNFGRKVARWIRPASCSACEAIDGDWSQKIVRRRTNLDVLITHCSDDLFATVKIFNPIVPLSFWAMITISLSCMRHLSRGCPYYCRDDCGNWPSSTLHLTTRAASCCTGNNNNGGAVPHRTRRNTSR